MHIKLFTQNCRNLQKNSRFLRNNSNYLPSLFGVCMHCCQPSVKQKIIVNVYVRENKPNQSKKPNFKKTHTQKQTITVILNLIYTAQFNTNGMVTALYIVVIYTQTHHKHLHMHIHEHSYSFTCTGLYRLCTGTLKKKKKKRKRYYISLSYNQLFICLYI